MIMERKIFKRVILLIVSVLLCTPSFGEAPPSLQKTIENQRPVSLQETLEHAYMQNADLDAARAGLRATDETLSQANAQWRPSLSVTGEQRQTLFYPIGASTRAVNSRTHNSNTSYTASVTQNIYQGGATVAAIGQAESNIFAGKAGLFVTEQDTLLNAVTAHATILANEDKVQYQQRGEDFYKKSVDRSQARFEVGEGARTDVAASEASYEKARADLSQALADLESSKATYWRQVGNPPGKLAPANVILEVPKRYEEALEVATKNNPAITQARYALEAAEYNVNLQIAGLLPVVNVQGDVGNSRGGGSHSFGAPHHPKRTDLAFFTTVTVPIYAQGIPNSLIRQAYQQVAQQKVNLVNVQRQVVEAVRIAWENLAAARESVKAFLAQVKAGELAVEGASEEVNVGTKTMLDVLELEQELITAQTNLADAQKNLIVTSYQVLQAMGRLMARDLKLKVKYYDPDKYYNEYKDAWIQFWQGKDLRYVKDGDWK